MRRTTRAPHLTARATGSGDRKLQATAHTYNANDIRKLLAGNEPITPPRAQPRFPLEVIGPDNPLSLVLSCQLLQRPAFRVEIVGLPCSWKTSASLRVKASADKEELVTQFIDTQREPFVPGAGQTEFTRTLVFADRFFLAVQQVEALWHDADLVLVEHYTGFTKAFECFGNGGKRGDIAKAVIRGIEEPDLTLYLVADPADTAPRGTGKFATDPVFLARMHCGLEILAAEKQWLRIETAGRTLAEVAADCYQIVADRIKTRPVARLVMPAF